MQLINEHKTMIVMVSGLPGSGKSYFASRLAARMGACYMNSDGVRMQMHKRTYSDQEKLAVYHEMLTQMQQAIKQSKSLVLDATFYKKDIRQKFRDEAARAGLNIACIEVQAAEPVIKERLKKRRADSEADFEVYKIVQSQWEPLREKHLVLQSTDDNISDMLHKAVDYLHVKNDERKHR